MRHGVVQIWLAALVGAAPVAASAQQADAPLELTLERNARRLQNEVTLGAFYRTVDWQPVFVAEDGTLTERGTVLRDALRMVIERNMLDTSTLGIAAANTAASAVASARDDEQRGAAALRLELALADVLTRVADELRYSHASAVPDVVADRALWRSAELVALLSRPADELSPAIAALTPQHRTYQNLLDAIAHYRALQASDSIDELPGEIDPDSPADLIVALRRRLALEGLVDDVETATWDEALGAAVMRYQQAHQIRNLRNRVGPQTLALLNAPLRERIGILVANADRMRESARDPDGLGDLVLVNVAGFRVEVWGGPERLFTARVIVGDTRDEDGRLTSRWNTPLFTDSMERIELNPTWYIPPSIEREVELNAELGIIRRGDQMLQLPGPHNVLGRVKFIFPNNNSVYLHDTLYPELFDRVIRTFSHGCIRLDDPLELATILIARDQGRDRDEVRAWIDEILETTETEIVMLQRPIGVAIEYYTAWVADDGVVEFYDDVYRITRRDERAARDREPLELLPDGSAS